MAGLTLSIGKFFKHEAYETLRRAIFYANYRIFRDDARLETLVESLQPALRARGLGGLSFERLQGFRMVFSEFVSPPSVMISLASFRGRPCCRPQNQSNAARYN